MKIDLENQFWKTVLKTIARGFTSRSEHLCRCGADDNQIDQDELFDCHVNSCRPGMYHCNT
ncbi:hypothetical protein MRB56_21065 [Halomonas cupida]|uniref:hypothetical protein n=1 Tax=Halomonas cupida TaxID=44933 RepID=UPI0011611F99